jgi:hypothetical protein
MRFAGCHSNWIPSSNGDKMKQPEIEEKIRAASFALNNMFKGYGHVLLVFPYGKNTITNYITNAGRTDMVKALRHCADALEKGDAMPTGVSTTLQ